MKSPHIKYIAAVAIDANSIGKMSYALNVGSTLINKRGRGTTKNWDHISMYDFVLNQEKGYYESDEPDLDELMGLADE